jgi:hypothetical protein
MHLYDTKRKIHCRHSDEKEQYWKQQALHKGFIPKG